MTTGSRLMSGAAWTYSSQVLTIVMQFGYAAITSRIVDSDGFGAYAVALAGGGLATLLASGGVGQAVGRMTDLESHRLSALAIFSLIIGTAAAAILFLGATGWSTLWRSPDSVGAIELLSVNAFTAPLVGLVTFLLRRQNRFRYLATATLAANLLGMVLGTGFVAYEASPRSLVASTIIAQSTILIACAVANRHLLISQPAFGRIQGDIRFSGALSLVRLVTYFNVSAGPWSVSAFLGPAVLGSWNRADVVSTVPMQQLQNVVVQTVYQEFRHDRRNNERSSIMWPDLFSFVAWVSLSAASAAAFIVPLVVPLLFGDGWEQARELIPYLAVIGGLTIVAALISSAIEALGRFRWIWAAQGIQFVITAAGIAVTIYLHDIKPLMVSGILVAGTKIWFYLRLAVASGIVDAKHLRRRFLHLAGGLLLEVFIGALVLLLCTSEAVSIGMRATLLSSLLLATTFAILKTWRRWDPVVIARQYGLFGVKKT
ncbi:oligosaccharide flippase family protein [Arthrobacter sp. AOP36-C1-22]|uniref:oligosaccharide flippase family protein n=1 Tax=Arthrobacter sp. AOP36-C1-22 TaxID=3457683 RepID=UPI0040335124